MHSIVSFFWGGGAGGYKQGNKLCEKIQIGITTGRLQTAGLVSADPSVCAFLVRQTAPTSVCQPVCPSCPVFVHVVKTILVPVLSACVCVWKVFSAHCMFRYIEALLSPQNLNRFLHPRLVPAPLRSPLSLYLLSLPLGALINS